MACALIGIAGQVTQIVMDRIRVPLTDAGAVPQVVVEERIPHIGFRFQQIQEAMAVATRLTPPSAIVQIDPHSRLAPIFLLYTDRQAAASDDGCNTPFGGDPRACLPMTHSLIQLFGGTGGRYYHDRFIFKAPIAFDPSLTTPENFARLCTADKLNVLVADYTDPVWWDKTSWVWTLKPAFANSTARVFPCVAAPSAGQG